MAPSLLPALGAGPAAWAVEIKMTEFLEAGALRAYTPCSAGQGGEALRQARAGAGVRTYGRTRAPGHPGVWQRAPRYKKYRGLTPRCDTAVLPRRHRSRWR